MSEKIGLDGNLYRNTGTYSTPVWTLIPTVRDLTLEMSASEADVSSRGQNFKLKRTALLELSVDGELIYNPTDPNYTALRDGFLNKTVIEFAVADGPIATSGTQYLRMSCQVFKFSRGEPLEGAMTNSFSIKPTPNPNADPAFVTVP
ncbi:MAG TPA: hypothetical protein VFA26_05155 [Gemmataceae bacterium]|nr:hypothetical protein [Gemmataceae bacterium]